MRFLFVVAPLFGHLAPMRGVADRLVADGHEVAWAGAGGWLRERFGPDATVFDCASPRFADTSLRPPDLRGPAAFQFLVDGYLVPLATEMLPGVRSAIERYRPDLVLADQHTWAGGAAAHLAGVPWATSAPTTAELVEPLPAGIAAWVTRRLADACPAEPDPRWSPSLVLAYTTPDLVRPVSVPENVRWVGPTLTEAGDHDWTPPWDRGRPLVVVTLGTANGAAGERFLRVCAEALSARTDLDTLVVDPDGVLGDAARDGNDAAFGGPDAAFGGNVRTVRWIPYLAVLRRTSLVICHSGQNTACDALWHGIPLVVAPIRDDQPAVAAQVVAAGAAVRLRFARAGVAQVAAAVDTVLGDPAYAAAAARIGASFRAAGGAGAAADALVELALASTPSATARA
ncbi:glycosyltransferase [Virgisporangium ochraceum]|uniref:Glycosyl transferase n=1 Tax=Virgisporangium ochraceum TaxID=65505 RepID=A0A8J4EA55_9ACTN|nr:nucleotide disphospho-sugar-binding domain-containing protein [Virgisporangium ochraceum]GIJ67164.1 glycosyl transferase [Virgisporangium ochraceum]